MVIRGKTRGNGAQLAGYLTRQADNDNVCVLDIRGTCQTEDLKSSLLEMSLTAELTMSDKGLYHAQINPAYGDDKKMQAADWLKAADILEEQLKLKDQKRVIVLHEKKGRTHAHVVWERYDHDKGIMVSDSYSRLAQDRARKAIESSLEQKETPHRNLRQPEMKKILSEAWQKTVTGKEFIKAAIQKGYTIAKGELRRPFMVVDETGRSFDLVRQLDKVKKAEVKARLQNEKLQTEKEVIQDIRTKQANAVVEQEQPKAKPKLSPGHWVERYEEKQATDIKEHIETQKEKAIRELKEQLERQRQKAKEMGLGY